MLEETHGARNAKSTSSTPIGEGLIRHIKQLVVDSKINDNPFYRTFRATRLNHDKLKLVFQQYYYYIRTFPQLLSGLASRVENEVIRMKLSRTVVSELGDNGEGKPHYQMFEDVLGSVGVELDDWRETKHIPEAEELVEGLKLLFLGKPANFALGAHYVIEEFGFPMIAALYEGFRQYDGWHHGDYAYFYLHLLIEANHVDWIGDAVLEAARDVSSSEQIERGAKEVLALLTRFWAGLDRVACA